MVGFFIMLNLIRSLIPYIKPIRDNNQDFPEGFCDIVTATICYVHKFPGAVACCGSVEYIWHFWIKIGSLNIDFTAHQFPSLMKHVSVIDGVSFVSGSDADLKAMGYTIEPDSYCQNQLQAVAVNSILGKVGDCSLNFCLLLD